MSAEAAAPAPRGAFSPKAVLAMLVVGLVAFSGFAVLGAYAPEMRSGDPGAHVLSRSAVGYAGLRRMLEGQGVGVGVSRRMPPYWYDPETDPVPLLILTPPSRAKPEDLEPFRRYAPILVVLPKWSVVPHQRVPGWVMKDGLGDVRTLQPLLDAIAPGAVLTARTGRSKPVLSGTGAVFADGTWLPLGEIDRLRTIAGPGWVPALVDETGHAVLACAPDSQICVLSDPDLVSTHGLASRDTARAGLAIVNGLRGPGGPVYFDVTLNGISADRNLLRLLLQPPLLGFTLCAVAAALLMGWRAATRFGPAAREGRALALGKQALVDNSAGLFRMAGKEHELAPAYVRLTEQLAAQAAGGERAPHAPDERLAWLDRMAAARGIDERLADLEQEAASARDRGDLLALARRLYHWRSEMMRDRR